VLNAENYLSGDAGLIDTGKRRLRPLGTNLLNFESSRFMHCNLLKRILGYVVGTIDFGITFSTGMGEIFDLTAYSDSDFVGLKDTRHSTSGYVMMLINESTTHASRRQATIAFYLGVRPNIYIWS
jgi:hypothetical protein